MFTNWLVASLLVIVHFLLGYCNFYWFIRLNHDLTWCNYFLSFVYWVFNANFSHFNWFFVCFVCLTVYKSCLALWYAQATMIWKYKLENSRNEQFQSFKLHAVLSGMIQSYVMLFGVWFLSGLSTWYMQQPCCLSLSSHLGYQVGSGSVGIVELVFKSSLFNLMVAPKYKGNDSGNWYAKVKCLLCMKKRKHRIIWRQCSYNFYYSALLVFYYSFL